MPQQPIPVVEVFIHDDATSALERIRQRMRQGEMQGLFRGITSGLKGLEDTARHIEREIGSLIRISGAGAFLGGGLVFGVNKLAQAMGNLARSSLQNRYLAQGLGVTSQQLAQLTAQGQALGFSAEQAKTGVLGLIEGLRDLQTYGAQSHIFQALAKGRGGVQLARELRAAVNGPGGIEEAMRLLAYRMQGMKPEGQKALSEIFGLGSVGFQDLFKFKTGELNEVLELSAADARSYVLAQTNLNISWDNTKKTIAVALMPTFERMMSTFDKFLQGPGGKIVKQAADWVASLDIDWDKLAADFVSGMRELRKVFGWVKWAFDQMDPIVQAMGGWTPIIAGLAVAVGVAGLAGAITQIAGALALVGRLRWVILAIAGIALLRPTAAQGAEAPPLSPGGAGGAGAPGSGAAAPGAMELPEVKVEPQRYQAPAAPDMPRIMRASYTPDGGRGGGYSDRDVEERAEDTLALRRMVKESQAEVAELGNYIASQAALTDETGAGGLAAIGGALRGPGGVPSRGGGPFGARAPFAPGGGGRPGGGGGGGGARPRRRGRLDLPPDTGPPEQPTNYAGPLTGGARYLAQERQHLVDQYARDPSLKLKVAAMIAMEVERDPTAVTESLYNRLNLMKKEGKGSSILRGLLGGFYGPINAGQLNSKMRELQRDPARLQKLLQGIDAAQSSNLLEGATDQGSGRDPNVNWPGGRKVRYGEVYNDWGALGHERARQYRENQQRKVREAEAASRQEGGPNVEIGPVAIGSAPPETSPPPAPGQPIAPPGLTPRDVRASREMVAVDPRLKELVAAAATHLPEGYIVKVTSGYSPTHGGAGSRHRQGRALDVQIYDPQGNPISNRGADNTGLYGQLARHAYGEMLARYPQLKGTLAWGGSFGTSSRNPNEPDLMHLDLGGQRGRLAPHLTELGAVPGVKYGQPGGTAAAGPPSPQAIAITREAEARARKAAEEARPAEPPPPPIQKSLIDELGNSIVPKRSRLPLKINVRGPRGVKVKAEGEGGVETSVERAITDPSGGVEGFSPA